MKKSWSASACPSPHSSALTLLHSRVFLQARFEEDTLMADTGGIFFKEVTSLVFCHSQHAMPSADFVSGGRSRSSPTSPSRRGWRENGRSKRRLKRFLPSAPLLLLPKFFSQAMQPRGFAHEEVRTGTPPGGSALRILASLLLPHSTAHTFVWSARADYSPCRKIHPSGRYPPFSPPSRNPSLCSSSSTTPTLRRLARPLLLSCTSFVAHHLH